MYVVGALDYERPLDRFLTLHTTDSTQRVPNYVAFMFRYLSMQLSKSRHCECAEALRSTRWAPTVDAQTSDIRTGIGGWEPKMNEHGVPDKSKSRWFSLEITKEKWPWVDAKGRQELLGHRCACGAVSARRAEGLPRESSR